MPRTLLQSAGTQNTGTSTTVACSFGGGTTNGSEVICVVTSSGGGLSSPTYTVSDGTNSYSSVQRIDDTSIHQATEIFHFAGVGAGITTITATASGSTTLSIAAGEFTASGSPAFDTAKGTTGTSTSPAPGSLAPGASADLAVTGVSDHGLNTLTAQTLTIPSGYTNVFNAGSNGSFTTSVGLAYKVFPPGTLPSTNPTWTESPSVAWSCNVATFNQNVDTLFGQGLC